MGIEDMNKNNVVILINTMGSGGAERVVKLLLDHFLIMGINAHLLVLRNDNAYSISNGVPYHVLTSDRKWRKILGYNSIILVLFRLKQYCRNHEIDLVLSHLSRSNYINALLRLLGGKARSIGVQHSHASNSYSSNTFKDRVNRILIKKLFPNLDKIIVISKVMKIDLINKFEMPSDRIELIGNPIDIGLVDSLKTVKCNFPFGYDSFTFMVIGSFIDRKNHRMVIEACRLLKHMSFNVIIMGRGELKKHYMTLINAYDLSHKIRIIDFDENPFSYLTNSQCLINTSNSEGLPMVLLEALVCQVPIISTDCLSGPREILAPGTELDSTDITSIEIADYGILTNMNDPKGLAEAMEYIMSNELYRASIKQKSRDRVAEYGLHAIGNQYLNLISDITR
jgi:N-acetylgalactosamine-N,N'-diacetylbacillosaminyl-diphospho-undecaprenol 4-alpha-N-acetylgalactosaminyltransferase